MFPHVKTKKGRLSIVFTRAADSPEEGGTVSPEQRRDLEQGDDAARITPLTGGYYWLPTPGARSVVWDILTCYQLGFDAEAGHVEMWDAVIDRLATAWGKDVVALGRMLKDCPYGLPRGRVTRPGRRFLVLHGDDWPRADGLERVVIAFGLDRRPVRVLFDEHERTMEEDRGMIVKALGLSPS
jgi:hypothetical protein